MAHHEGVCRFTEPHYGYTVCDQGDHEAMFCITCGNSVPSYMNECSKCEDAAMQVANLEEILSSTRRALVMEKRKELNAAQSAEE